MNDQITDTLFMVRPSAFGFNAETAASNSFQKTDKENPELIKHQAIKEFDDLVSKLRSAGIEILVHQEDHNSNLTDSVFPNNWFSTHQCGTLVTYPMFSVTRRKERKPEIIDFFKSQFKINNEVHLKDFESENEYLESTGSMILDRRYRKVYAAKSIRTSEKVINYWAKHFHYKSFIFSAIDPLGLPIYHTNVIMALGETIAIICGESIKDKVERNALFTQLENTNHIIIDITFDQVKSFAGNVLQVKNKEYKRMMIMSSSAYKAFSPEQLNLIKSESDIIHSPIPTIEKYGGGSVRCMLAEIFLPQKEIKS